MERTLNQDLQKVDLTAIIDNLPKRYNKYDFDDMITNDDNRKHIENCKKYNSDFQIKGKTSIIFTENIGAGKTRLAVATLKNMKPKKIKSLIKEYDGKLRSHKSVYLLADMFFNKMNESASQGGKENVINSFLNYDIVLLDDLSLENFTPAKQENLYLLINEVYLQEKSIFITMNFSTDVLQKAEPRAADRLVEIATLMTFKGESFRK